MKFILGIAAGKGGVGKSSLTVNLALCLDSMGWSVGIMDADVYGPSIAKMLPEDLPARNSQESQKIIPAEKKGIKLISISHFLNPQAAMIVRAPIANAIIKQFFHAVDWGDLDCLLIDFPPGTGDIQLTLMQEAVLSGALLITSPQEVCLQDVSKAIAQFHKMQVPILGLVENMSYFQDPLSERRYYPFGKAGGLRLCIQEGIPLLGEIPFDEQISQCGDEGTSILNVAKEMPSVKIFKSIAHQVKEQLTYCKQLEGEYLEKIHLIWSRS